jgi:type IV conjugative transfer system lipoprotein TraV
MKAISITYTITCNYLFSLMRRGIIFPFSLFFIACFLTFFLTCFLTGCAGMNTANQCGVDKGIPCTRIDELNRKLNRGEILLDREELEQESLGQEKLGEERLDRGGPEGFRALQGSLREIEYNEGERTIINEEGVEKERAEKERMEREIGRTRDRTLKAYISSYADKKGNYHMGHYIHSVIEQGHWVGGAE